MIKSPSRVCLDETIEHLVGRYCPKHGAAILDVGCGQGRYYQYFVSQARRGTYLGIDIKQSPAWQNKTENGLNVSYSSYNAENLENFNQKFNFIISIQALEHIKYDEKAIKGINKCLLTAGRALITVPSKFSFFLYGPHGHRRYGLKSIQRMAEKAGLAVEETIKIGGLCSFLLHFLTWTIPAIIFRLKIWRLYRRYEFLGKLLFKMEKAAYRLDKCLRIFESGYAVMLKKNP